MLTIRVGSRESWDKEKEEFVFTGGFDLEFEHSLVSLSKWESIHKKPFIAKTERSSEETLDYIRAMLLTPNPPSGWLEMMTKDDFDTVSDYITDSQTATTFSDKSDKTSREVITSELIYYWMFAAQIPIECEKWHLNRLITLIRVFGVKNQDPKKMSKSEIAARNRELNAQRRKKYGTKG